MSCRPRRMVRTVVLGRCLHAHVATVKDPLLRVVQEIISVRIHDLEILARLKSASQEFDCGAVSLAELRARDPWFRVMEDDEKSPSEEETKQRQEASAAEAAKAGGGWGGWGFSPLSVLSDLQKAAEEISRNVLENLSLPSICRSYYLRRRWLLGFVGQLFSASYCLPWILRIIVLGLGFRKLEQSALSVLIWLDSSGVGSGVVG